MLSTESPDIKAMVSQFGDAVGCYDGGLPC